MITFLQIAAWAACIYTTPPVDAYFLYAIAMCESSMNPAAVSDAGAQGLYQFMPGTVKDIQARWGFTFDPFEPEQATKAAALYLSWLCRVFDDDIEKILASWVWGIGNVRKWEAGEKKLPEDVEHFIYLFLSEYVTIRLSVE